MHVFDTGDSSSDRALDHHIVIIGAGFSGIGMANRLDQAGLSDYLIVEEGHGFGGTWYWNRYPGLSVDIPSFSYQFSFAKQARWSRVCASGEELREYADHCADRFRLRGRVRFGTRVTGATFDEGRDAWQLSTSTGTPITTRHVVDATGVLTQPRLPDIKGVETFAGTTMHTARWDHNLRLEGKRVAVIGTGASGVQLIPAVAPQAAHLTVFQRTPAWCLPRFDPPLPPSIRWLLRSVPGAAVAFRLLSQSYVELVIPLAFHYHRTLRLSKVLEFKARAYLRDQIPDSQLRDGLTPRYALGCKRPTFHNEYLATFNRPNVTLETDPIDRITSDSIITRDGRVHQIDALLLATGFKGLEPGNLPKFPVSGRYDAELGQWWTQHRHQAYEGVSVPGFPNYFFMFGPYSYNGSSYFNLVETQSRHILRCLSHARSAGATRIEVRPEANDRYFAEVLSRRPRQVFWQSSCSMANSYFFDARGDVPLRPSATIETMWRSRRFPLRDYCFERGLQPG